MPVKHFWSKTSQWKKSTAALLTPVGKFPAGTHGHVSITNERAMHNATQQANASTNHNAGGWYEMKTMLYKSTAIKTNGTINDYNRHRMQGIEFTSTGLTIRKTRSNNILYTVACYTTTHRHDWWNQRRCQCHRSESCAMTGMCRRHRYTQTLREFTFRNTLNTLLE